MKRERLEYIVKVNVENYTNTIERLKNYPPETQKEIHRRTAEGCYHIAIHLRELGDPSYKDWLRKMIEHYEKGKEALYFKGKWHDLLAFDHLLEAAIILEDKNLLNNLAEWSKDPNLWDGRMHSGIKKRMIERAIILNKPDVAIQLLEDFDLTRGNVDSYTKNVSKNAREIYEAILNRDRETFEKEVSEMKKRWKRTREGRQFNYCVPEIIYRGLFDIFMSHEKGEDGGGDRENGEGRSSQ